MSSYHRFKFEVSAMSTETKYTESVNFYCTTEMREWIQQRANIEKITRTQVIRNLVQTAMDNADTQVKRTRIYGTGFL